MSSADTKVSLMLAVAPTPGHLACLRERYTLYPAYSPEDRMAVASEKADVIRGIVTRGDVVLRGDLMDRLPNLGIIASMGVGYEGTDLAAARARGIAVTYCRGVNADTVADQAMALALATIRRVPFHDSEVREGRHRDMASSLPQMTGKRAGILGMGDIGMRIAQRCAGFDMPVAYYARREAAGVPWRRATSVADLAACSDVLFAAVPGGTETHHIVDAAVLEALGPTGYLVNVGRGSVVDTQAVIHALENGKIAGVGLDVVEGEPDIPFALRRQPMAVFSPHIGGLSPEAKHRATQLLLQNLEAYFAGEPVITPVPMC